MADIADLGNDRAEEIRGEQLAKRKPEGPKPNGGCHWCGEFVDIGERFCPGVECRDDWDSDQKRKKQNGNGMVDDE